MEPSLLKVMEPPEAVNTYLVYILQPKLLVSCNKFLSEWRVKNCYSKSFQNLDYPSFVGWARVHQEAQSFTNVPPVWFHPLSLSFTNHNIFEMNLWTFESWEVTCFSYSTFRVVFNMSFKWNLIATTKKACNDLWGKILLPISKYHNLPNSTY